MKKEIARQRLLMDRNTVYFIGLFIIAVVAAVVPVYSVRSKSLTPVSKAFSMTDRSAGASERGSMRYLPALHSALLSGFRSALPIPQAPSEMIETFASDCITPKTDFDLGAIVCAKVSGAPLPVDGRAQRRIGWVSPYGSLAQGADITTDPQYGTYQIPTEQTQTFTDSGGGTVVVDNRGTWSVNTFSTSDGSRRTSAFFTVHDPATPYVDLSVGQSVSEANSTVPAGSSSEFSIIVSNRGPDSAANVVLTDNIPNNTTFVAIAQTSGPTFTCTAPVVGGTGTITCSIATLARGDVATFDLAYNVNAGTPDGTLITNTATISSATAELVTDDNSSTKSSRVAAGGGGGTGTCSVGCPDDITTPANTVDQDSNPGAVVHFSPPSGNDECGAVVVDHCNDCFFPVGTTVVTATAVGDSCSFTVTITAAGSAPRISCPGNKTADADASACSTNVNVGTATATGTNVTVIGYRNDGQPMYTCDKFGNCTRNSSDAPFSAGTTTITWYAYAHDVPGPYTGPVDGDGDPTNPADTEEGHRVGSATCTQTVMVNDVTPPTIGATSSTVSADANCQAVIPDYSSTVTDNCACGSSDTSDACQGHPHIIYTQTPAAGTVVGPGAHNVHIEATDGSSNNNGATKDVTFTVNDTTAPAITCPADIVRSNDPGQCSAVVAPGTATATDSCDSSPTIVGTRSDNQPLNAPYPKGTTIITWSATDDAGNTSSCSQSVTVNDTEPPTILCPAPIVQGNDPGTCSATVNPGQPTAADNCGNPTVTSTRSDGQPLNAPYPKGTTTITWRATDSSGNYSECTQTVTVVDNEKPTFTFTATQSMWPPNHKYQTFTMASLVASVHDNCDGNIPITSVVITKVTSDEIENGNGDGNTLNDIVIAANCKSVQLRSEREGSGNGRVYTIFFSVTDGAGNKGTGTTKVVVPHNPGETAVDSGPHYTVTSNCP